MAFTKRAIPLDEYKRNLSNIKRLTQEAARLVEQAFAYVEGEYNRRDYGNIDMAAAATDADTVLASARSVLAQVEAEVDYLQPLTYSIYPREVRVGFPYGLTHFTVASVGGKGTLTLVGRNDDITSLADSLFAAGDQVMVLASSKLNAADINRSLVIDTISGEVITFTTDFTSPTAGNDTTLHLRLMAR